MHWIINVFLIALQYCLLCVDNLQIRINPTICVNGFHSSEEKSAEKEQLSQLNEALNDVNNGNGSNVSIMENETLEQQTNGQHNDFERFVDSASQNQLI